MRKRYNSFKVVIPIEFDGLFNNSQREDPQIVLRMLSRDAVVKLAALLTREYCEQPALKIANFLSKSDSRLIPFSIKLHKYVEDENHIKGVEVVVTFNVTVLELLRIAFSISPSEMQDISPIQTDELNWRLIKLITQLNQSVMDFSLSDQCNIDNFLLVNDASYNDIQRNEAKNQFLIQPIQAILFFRHLESSPRYSQLLSEFCKLYGITSWKEYVRTIYTLSLQYKKQGPGIYPRSLVTKESQFISQSVLDKLSINAERDCISYSCANEYCSTGNSDYREFKARPLFKLSNGDYVLYNLSLLLDRLFQGLYFDFQNIKTRLTEKQPDIANLFTSEFMEKTLFSGVVKDCVNSNKYKALNEEQLISIHKPNQNELGCPDFLISSKNNRTLILFECKDIRLNAWIKEQRDYTSLEKELKNKIVCKTYQTDRERQLHRNLPKPRRVGVGQLAYHVANVRKGSFQWFTYNSGDVVIYPVLVIADNRMIFEGLPSLAEAWYEESLSGQGIDKSDKNRPLIMMSPLTFIKYQSLFKSKGLEYYFEKYYVEISRSIELAEDLFNKRMSFDTFMEKYSFSLSKSRRQIIQSIYEI